MGSGDARWLPRSPVAWVAETLARADALHRSRPDLAAAFRRSDPGSAEAFWHWLAWHGPDEAPDVVAALPPLPDRALRDRVVGAQPDVAFVRSGLTDYRRIVACLRSGGFDPARGGRVLDFGAGCGRILRHFAFFSGGCAFTAVDPDAAAVAWCREHLGFATARRIDASPPTSLPAEHFDAVYAFSVFTHLSEERHLAWLAELARVSRPGAVLVLTTHGARVEEIVRAGSSAHLPPARELFDPSRATAGGDYRFVPFAALGGGPVRRFAARLRRLARGDAPAAAPCSDPTSGSDSHYGVSIVREAYVRERWSAWFDVADYLAAPDDYQDYVVLRRRRGYQRISQPSNGRP